jgi:hypothetical protein
MSIKFSDPVFNAQLEAAMKANDAILARTFANYIKASGLFDRVTIVENWTGPASDTGYDWVISVGTNSLAKAPSDFWQVQRRGQAPVKIAFAAIPNGWKLDHVGKDQRFRFLSVVDAPVANSCDVNKLDQCVAALAQQLSTYPGS